MTEQIEWMCTTQDRQWFKRTDFQHTDNMQTNLAITETQNQIWQGFGGCFNEIGWDVLQKVCKTDRDLIVKTLFADDYDCNFNFFRSPIGASDYALSWYSLNETPGDYDMSQFSIDRDKKTLIPYIKEAQKYSGNFKIFSSPWSPPTWMKHPPVYNFGTLVWDKKTLNAYALYFKKYIQAYAEQGIKINQIHVQNEPISSQKFPSCIWTGPEFAEFIGNYLGPLFEKESIDTEIWLGTLNGPETDQRKWKTDYNHYAGFVLNDSKAAKYIKGVSYQWAGKHAIQKTHLAYPDMPLIQSENECGTGDNSWEHAFYVYDLMQHYISNGVIAYIYWNMVLPPGGMSSWGWKQNSMITIDPETKEIIKNPEYYIIKHLSHYVKPGYRYVCTSGPWSANTICFKDNNKYIIAIKNPFKNDVAVCFELSGNYYQFDLPAESINSIIVLSSSKIDIT